jgi:hypothetical protein
MHGMNFQNVEDVKFESIIVEYSNLKSKYGEPKGMNLFFHVDLI